MGVLHVLSTNYKQSLASDNWALSVWTGFTDLIHMPQVITGCLEYGKQGPRELCLFLLTLSVPVKGS